MGPRERQRVGEGSFPPPGARQQRDCGQSPSETLKTLSLQLQVARKPCTAPPSWGRSYEGKCPSENSHRAREPRRKGRRRWLGFIFCHPPHGVSEWLTVSPPHERHGCFLPPGSPNSSVKTDSSRPSPPASLPSPGPLCLQTEPHNLPTPAPPPGTPLPSPRRREPPPPGRRPGPRPRTQRTPCWRSGWAATACTATSSPSPPGPSAGRRRPGWSLEERGGGLLALSAGLPAPGEGWGRLSGGRGSRAETGCPGGSPPELPKFPGGK